MIYRTLKTLTQKTLLFVLSLYRDYLSYYLPSRCRFYPSCSHYSYEAIKEHGSIRGAHLSVQRLLRCHPWHAGGFDPVPKHCSNSKKHKHFETDSPTHT